MNERVRSHFDEIEARLIECPVILSYEITRRDISTGDGKLRIKSVLTGGGVFECFLCVKDTGYRIHLLDGKDLDQKMSDRSQAHYRDYLPA